MASYRKILQDLARFACHACGCPAITVAGDRPPVRFDPRCTCGLTAILERADPKHRWYFPTWHEPLFTRAELMRFADGTATMTVAGVIVEKQT